MFTFTRKLTINVENHTLEKQACGALKGPFGSRALGGWVYRGYRLIGFIVHGIGFRI